MWRSSELKRKIKKFHSTGRLLSFKLLDGGLWKSYLPTREAMTMKRNSKETIRAKVISTN